MNHCLRLLKGLLVLLMIGYFCPAMAQDFDNYQLLRSGDEVPPPLQASLTEKIGGQFEENGLDVRKRRNKLEQERFFIGSNVFTDRLFRSGLVWFDDPVGQYLNQIKDYLLREDQENRDRIRVYLVRSPEVNAFATAGGEIFVCLGLVAQAQDESTLAFVLAHEIQHVLKKHIFRTLEQKITGKKKEMQGKFRNEEEMAEFLKSKTKFSRNQETEADQMGLRLFLNSAYHRDAIDQAMDLLRGANLPFSEDPWDSTMLALDSLVYPSEYFLDSVNVIDADEFTNDEMSSHPNVGTRREDLSQALAEHLENGGETGVLKFLFGEEKFLHMREISRFELCNAQVADYKLPEAIWTAHLLLQKYPKNVFLQRMIGQSLYRLAKVDANGSPFSTERKSGKVQGESQRLHHFLAKLKGVDLAVVALKYNWARHLQYPEEETFQMICEDLAFTIVHAYPVSFRKLEGRPRNLVNRLPAKTDHKSKHNYNSPLVRLLVGDYDMASVRRNAKVSAFAQSALKTEFSEPEFLKIFGEAVTKEEGIRPSASKKRKKKKKKKKASKASKVPEHGFARKVMGYELGQDKVVMSPVKYTYLDLEKAIEFRYKESDKFLEKYKSTLVEMGEKLPLNLEMLDYAEAEPGDLNDIGVLSLWIRDKSIGYDLDGTVNLYHNEAKQLSDKYGTRYFAWNGMLHTKNHLGLYNRFYVAAPGLLLYPALPLTLWLSFKGYHRTLYSSLVFDLVSDELKMEEINVLKVRPRGKMLKSILYNTLYQIQKKPGK